MSSELYTPYITKFAAAAFSSKAANVAVNLGKYVQNAMTSVMENILIIFAQKLTNTLFNPTTNKNVFDK